MKKIEDWIDKDTVVFIELDDTIILPQSKMFLFNSNPNREFINNLVSLSDKIPDYKAIAAKWYQQRKVKLVEEAWVDFISRVKAKGATVYGICKLPVGLINLEEKRISETKELGIIFTNLINNQEKLLIEKAEQEYSIFYKGIIFTGPYSKSRTLLEFLRVANMVPPKMVIIGSAKHEVKRIDRDLRVFNMYYYSVHYLGAREVPGRPDKDIMKIQQQELIQNGRWLEDEAAAQLLGLKKQVKE